MLSRILEEIVASRSGPRRAPRIFRLIELALRFRRQGEAEHRRFRNPESGLGEGTRKHPFIWRNEP